MFKTLVMIIRIWLLLVISWQIWAVPNENGFALKRQVGDFCVGRTAPVIGNRSVIQAPCLLCGHWTLDSGEQITLFRIFVLLRQALYKPLTTQYMLWSKLILNISLLIKLSHISWNATHTMYMGLYLNIEHTLPVDFMFTYYIELHALLKSGRKLCTLS